jgi:L-ascorbate metabolism protein UlaG (beta-lactamase superfamily)
MTLELTLIDTACLLININGYKILTDPTLDKAGGLYYHGFGALSRKTGDPAYLPKMLEDVDLVLLSHHQHRDNLDNAGENLLCRSKKVISTVPASKVFPGVIGLNVWESTTIQTDKVKNLKITATPAQHRPSWMPEFISGKVIGFVIEYDEQQNGVIYLSGDTVYFSGIEEVAARFQVDIAIFNAGAVQFRYLTGCAKYTMDAEQLIQAAKAIQPNKIFPIHTQGWTHFKESEASLMTTLFDHEFTRNKTLFLSPGIPALIPI